MKSTMKKKAAVVSAIISMLMPLTALADVPPVDINKGPDQPQKPFGAFRIVICDGPDLSGLKEPIEITLDGKKITTTPGQNPKDYRPCNFKGLMEQVQYVINIMIVAGVVAAIIGMAFAGYLYLTGVPSKIERAKKIFPKLLIGFILMLTAWFIVAQILIWLTGSSAYLTGTKA